MANFSQALNTDLNGKLTTAVYDASIAGWVQKIQTHVLNSAGILVPLQLNSSGNIKTAISEAIPAGNNNIGDVDVASCALPVGAATQTTLAAVLAKIIAAPATEAKQDTLIAKDFATQTTLAAILAKIIAAPATDAKVEAVRALLAGTLTATLTGMLPAGTNNIGDVDVVSSVLPTDAATQTTLAAILTQLNTTGLKKIIDPLPTGTNNIGDVDVLTLPSIPAGTNNIGDVDVASIAAGDNVIGRVKQVAAVPGTATLQSAAGADGNGTDFTVDGYGVTTLQITGTFSATVTFQGSVDGTNFVTLGNDRVATPVVTTTGIFGIDCRGLQKIRAVISGYVSGNVTVTGRAEPFAGSNNTVQLTGSTISDGLAVKKVNKSILTTIINAVSVAASGNTGYVSCGIDGTEDEVWVAVSIDRQPWTLIARTIFSNNGIGTYPKYANVVSTYGSLTLPALALVLGVIPSSQGLTDPTTMQEARAVKLPLSSTVQVRVDNADAVNAATVTVKILRVWR